MIDALVKFGVKDQNVVLSTMDKITKKKAALAKQTGLGLGKDKGGALGLSAKSGPVAGLAAGLNALKGSALEASKAQRSEAQQSRYEEAKEKFENSKFVKSAKAAGEALQTVARGAATLDPVSFIQSTLSAAGKISSSIPFLGGAAQGGLELAGVSVGAAGGAIGSAKQSTAGALEIQKRNAQNNLYGGNVNFGSAEKRARELVEKKNAAEIARAEAVDRKNNLGVLKKATGGATANTASALRESLILQAQKTDTSDKASGWTPADKTNFIQSVSGAFGKIQKPLADTLNSFIERGKNVEQFTQVASGNWNALGTDEGAILQQISNGFAGALPTIRQELQKELLKSYGDRVADESKDLANRRAAAAAWARQDEAQTNRVADAAASVGKTLYLLDSRLNEVQIKLINGAGKLAEAVNKAVDIMS